MKVMRLGEFRNEIKAQGVQIGDVTFECPNCRTLQSANDLILAGAGKTIEEVEKYVAFSCIGRFDSGKGCDWTLGGLLQIHELEVETEDGKRHPRFLPKRRD